MIHDLFAAIGVLVILGAVMVIAKLCYKRLTPEGARKTIHIVMGCTALALPYIFEYKQSAVYLGIAAIALLVLMRRNEVLRKAGIALLGVERKTLGDIYFVIAIVIVFVLHQSTFEYIIPIAILTFADSIAALVGITYGRYNMAQHEEEAAKSREGSVMFFIVAFICTLIPLQLMSGVGRTEVLVISFLIGILAAMIEAVTRKGNDNLMLPLLTFSILQYNIEQPLDLIFTNFGIMLLLLVIVFVVYKITNITRLSMTYSMLVGYIIMILGDITWVAPPLMLFLTFGILPMMKNEEKNMMQTYKVIECNSIIGIICLVLSGFFPEYREILNISFSLSFAINLAINTYSRLINFQNRQVSVAVVYGFVKAIGFIALPTFAIIGMHGLIFAIYLVFVAIAMPFAVSLNKKYNYKKVGDETFKANKILVGVCVALFTVILVILGGVYDLFG